MKAIIIKKENADAIRSALSEVQSRAKERTTTYEDILDYISSVERRIGKISKKALEGTYFVYDHRQHFPSAYKYRAQSTWIKVLYSKGSWRLTGCGRSDCPNVTSGYPYRLELSESAKADILQRYV